MSARWAWGAIGAMFALVGCSNDHSQIGTGEPFRVAAAQFFTGQLPGTPLPAADAGTTAPDPGTGSPDAGAARPAAIVDFATSGRTPSQGQGGFHVKGSATPNAYSIGLALAGVGSGYWVFPAGAPEPDTGNLAWSADCDFDVNIPSGFYNLQAVAFDAEGQAGTQAQKQICVASRVPDNFNACTASAPPQTVISLTWDRNADLDLQIQMPSGNFVDAKSPRTTDADGGVDGNGALDRDSNAGCAIDGIRAENLLWQTVKPSGRYGIYVNLFDACKQPAVTFTVSVYSSVDDGDGGKHLDLQYSKSGVLLDSQANGGAARGLFVTEVVFN